MFFSPHERSRTFNSYLPIAFERALLSVGERDGFAQAVTIAANEAGCEFLFEVPSALFGENSGRAAVIRSCQNFKSNNGRETCNLYIIFDDDDGIIRILEEYEVPNSVQAMTNSYSTVLEIIASDNGKSRRPLH